MRSKFEIEFANLLSHIRRSLNSTYWPHSVRHPDRLIINRLIIKSQNIYMALFHWVPEYLKSK